MERMRRTVSGLVAIALAAVLPLAACWGRTESTDRSPHLVSDSIARSPYDWSCLAWDERGRVSYVVDGTVRSRTGIDVSEHQGTIDWQAVAGDGIDFCYIRAAWRGSTEGALYEDEQFRANLEGARTAGLDVGLYVFSQAATAEEGREEAEFVLALLGGESLDLPIAFDHELTSDRSGRADNISHDELTAAAHAFCDTVEAAGYEALIYGNSYEYARLDILSFGRYGYWFAEYDEAPSIPFELYLWQYTHQGSVAGIGTGVDMSIELVHALDGEGRR